MFRDKIIYHSYLSLFRNRKLQFSYDPSRGKMQKQRQQLKKRKVKKIRRKMRRRGMRRIRVSFSPTQAMVVTSRSIAGLSHYRKLR